MAVARATAAARRIRSASVSMWLTMSTTAGCTGSFSMLISSAAPTRRLAASTRRGVSTAGWGDDPPSAAAANAWAEQYAAKRATKLAMKSRSQPVWLA